MAVCLYSDSIMYDRHDKHDEHDTYTDNADDKDTKLEDNISRNIVLHKTERIRIDKTYSLDKEMKPDKDAVQEPQQSREK